MSRRFINVSYEDRDLAKKLGARWDPSLKRWYYAKGSELAKVFGWRAASASNEQTKTSKPSSLRRASVDKRDFSFGDLFDQANTRYG